MLNIELEKRIQKEIDQSGFPLELDVVADLREANYIVSPNLSFSNGERLAREIDAVAFSNEETPDGWPFGVIGNVLAVECKRQRKKPWVFFEEGLDPLAVLGLGTEIDILTELEYTLPYNVLAACMNSPLRGHHFNGFLPRARTYFEAFSKPNQENSIYKAVQSVWHALTFIRSWFGEQGFDRTPKASAVKRRTFLLQGVIVLDGQLLLASKEGDEFTLAESDHIILRTIDRLTREGKSAFGIGEEIVIDVVSYRGLAKYLDQSVKNVELLSQHLSAQLKAGWILDSSNSSSEGQGAGE
ncbi:MAG: hypothetical protein AAGI91_02595 [Bacteroidota bacterium]